MSFNLAKLSISWFLTRMNSLLDDFNLDELSNGMDDF